MRKDLEQALKHIAQTVPSGGNVSLNNPHDIPNIVNHIVPILRADRTFYHEDVRQKLMEYGQSSETATDVANVLEIVSLTIGAMER